MERVSINKTVTFESNLSGRVTIVGVLIITNEVGATLHYLHPVYQELNSDIYEADINNLYLLAENYCETNGFNLVRY